MQSYKTSQVGGSSISPRTGCPLGIVNDEDHKVESCGATIPMCLHGTKSKIFKNNTFSMTNVSLNDRACFDYYSNTSCLYRKRDNDKTIDPNFTPIDNFNYANQLRVLTILRVLIFLKTIMFQITKFQNNI